jgi:hypothetical protein
MNHPMFENDFMEIAKGLPDLERIVSRIHAKNCKIRDFLKVLQAFKKLSRGLSEMANTAENFDSKTIFGLLRGAPDLMQNIKKVQAMYEKPESEKGCNDLFISNSVNTFPDATELVPQAGKDPVYDEIMAEIKGLETELDEELEGFQKKLKCVRNVPGVACSQEFHQLELSCRGTIVPKEPRCASGAEPVLVDVQHCIGYLSGRDECRREEYTQGLGQDPVIEGTKIRYSKMMIAGVPSAGKDPLCGRISPAHRPRAQRG